MARRWDVDEIMMCGSNKKYIACTAFVFVPLTRWHWLSKAAAIKKNIACPAIPNQRKLTEEDEVKSTVSESKPLTQCTLILQGGSNKKTHRVSRDTKTEKNRRFLRFFVLSPVPKIGKGFGKRLKPLLEEGVGWSKRGLGGWESFYTASRQLLHSF